MFYEVVGGRKQLLAQERKTGVKTLSPQEFLHEPKDSFLQEKVSVEGVWLSRYGQD